MKKPLLFRTGRVLRNLDSPKVMGILNVTPDSFYDGGRYQTEDLIRARAGSMLELGADILDIGACSTRPGAALPDEEEEKARLAIALELIRTEFPEAIISVDTFRAGIAAWAIENFEVPVINDISAGNMDSAMFETIARYGAVYVIMHMQGTPETMQVNPHYSDVTGEVCESLARKIHELEKLGIPDVWVDPGFGFGKTLEDNYRLLDQLERFRILERPILVGLSRKSMIYKVLACEAESALNGTTALNMAALLKNADILRVHDVKQARECVRLAEKILN